MNRLIQDRKIVSDRYPIYRLCRNLVHPSISLYPTQLPAEFSTGSGPESSSRTGGDWQTIDALHGDVNALAAILSVKHAEGTAEISRWRKPPVISRKIALPGGAAESIGLSTQFRWVGKNVLRPCRGVVGCDLVRWLTPPANFQRAVRHSVRDAPKTRV